MDADRDRNTTTVGDDPWDFGTSGQHPVLLPGGLGQAHRVVRQAMVSSI